MGTSRAYKIKDGSIQEGFFACYKKLQMYAGGFGNGKTSAVTVRTLQIAKDYPGSNILVARETFPKVNDTIRKEFIHWTPKKWIKKLPTDDNNNLILQNGSVINFRYIAQQGKNTEQSSSNLLSANYDLVVVDQVEDPKITHKDFRDLFGRLRGQTAYTGDDSNMPRSGPRWMFLTANASRNWVYRKLIYPFHLWNKNKIKHPDLIVGDDGLPMLALFESSTFENADNLPPDYLEGLRATYTGQSFNRYILGKWDAYDGLVYPEFDSAVHVIPHEQMLDLFTRVRRFADVEWIAGYDHGLAAPACYLLSYTDMLGNVHVVDGFYQAEMLTGAISRAITEVNNRWKVQQVSIYADPSIFKRVGQVGPTLGDTFQTQYQIPMLRANNSIISGIDKVGSYLSPVAMRKNPYTGVYGSPRIFFSDNLTAVIDEFGEYMWARDTSGEAEDKPKDHRDHAMDTIKYLLTPRASIARVKTQKPEDNIELLTWRERESVDPDPRTRSRRLVG